MKIRSILLPVMSLFALTSAAGRTHSNDPHRVPAIHTTPPQLSENRSWSANAILQQAIDTATRIVVDTTFVAVLHEMEEAGEYSWRAGRVSDSLLYRYPPDARAKPVSWLLARLVLYGQFDTARISLRTTIEINGKPSPSTRAATYPCSYRQSACPATRGTTLRRDIVAESSLVPLTNTLLHERMHAFGHVHWKGNRPTGLCEAPYVMGDLAELILFYRQDGRATRPRQTPCPALQRRLRSRGITGLAPSGVFSIQQPDSAHWVLVDYYREPSENGVRAASYVDTSRVTRLPSGAYHTWVHQVWRNDQRTAGRRYRSILEERDVECGPRPRFRRLVTTYSRGGRVVATSRPRQPEFIAPNASEELIAVSLCEVLARVPQKAE
jgi:hypothetical protein